QRLFHFNWDRSRLHRAPKFGLPTYENPEPIAEIRLLNDQLFLIKNVVCYLLLSVTSRSLMTKEELLAELTNHSYVALRPSPIEGIGVFAYGIYRKAAVICSANHHPTTSG